MQESEKKIYCKNREKNLKIKNSWQSNRGVNLKKDVKLNENELPLLQKKNNSKQIKYDNRAKIYKKSKNMI